MHTEKEPDSGLKNLDLDSANLLTCEAASLAGVNKYVTGIPAGGRGRVKVHLLTRDAGEKPIQLHGRREEHCMITIWHTEHFLGRVGSNHGVLIGRGDTFVLPRSNVESPYSAEFGRTQGQDFRSRHVGSVRKQQFRQVDILCRIADSSEHEQIQMRSQNPSSEKPSHHKSWRNLDNFWFLKMHIGDACGFRISWDERLNYPFWCFAHVKLVKSVHVDSCRRWSRGASPEV